MSLRELLDEEAGFDCEYGGGLSNHRPMALAALTRSETAKWKRVIEAGQVRAD